MSSYTGSVIRTTHMTGIVTDIGLITGRRCKTTGGWRLNQLSLFEGWGWWCLMKYIGTHIHSPIQGEFAAWMESGLRFGYSGCGFGFCNAGFYFSQQTVAAGWRCCLWKNQRAEMIRWKHWGRFYCICFYLNMQIKWYAFKMFGLKTPPSVPQRFPYPSLAPLPPNLFPGLTSKLLFLANETYWEEGTRKLMKPCGFVFTSQRFRFGCIFPRAHYTLIPSMS